MPGSCVVVHGFDPSGSLGCREPEEIWRDRLKKAFSLAGSLGENTKIIISGGVGEKPESVVMNEFAEKEFPEASEFEIITEEEAEDGQENADYSLEIAEELGCNSVYAVSSVDHLPRVEKAWQNAAEKSDIEFYSVSSSKTTLRHPIFYLIYLPLLFLSGEHRYYY